MRRPIVFVVLAAMGAVLAAIVVFSAIRKRETEVQRAMAHTVEVVVAANDIQVGTKLDSSSVKVIRWARDSVPAGAFTDPNAVAGAFAKSGSSPTSRWSPANSSPAKWPRASCRC